MVILDGVNDGMTTSNDIPNEMHSFSHICAKCRQRAPLRAFPLLLALPSSPTSMTVHSDVFFLVVHNDPELFLEISFKILLRLLRSPS
jgi:hypothetical protein